MRKAGWCRGRSSLKMLKPGLSLDPQGAMDHGAMYLFHLEEGCSLFYIPYQSVIGCGLPWKEAAS